MRAIVADVGGTNTRMAYAAGGMVVAGSTRWFRNDDFGAFGDVLAAFHDGPVDAVCVAIAGPVMPGLARLTNRDWAFDADALAATLGGAQVHFVNDLAAVGHAVPYLRSDTVRVLVPGAAAPAGQVLVAGIGTGFNVSLARDGTVFLAELGHAGLPARVVRALQGHVDAARFGSIEALFAGAGLRALHTAMTGAEADTDAVVQDHPETMAIYVRALAALFVELTYTYMPLGGIYLNGGLGRAVSELAGVGEVLAAARITDAFDGRLADIPVWTVTDDAAALMGCAAVLGAQS